MGRKLEVFVAVKGHAFSRDAFEAMLRAVGAEPTMVDQPAAAMLMNPQAMARFDAILFYDMPGMDFRAPVGERPGFVEPEPAFREGFEALLRQGKGIVALHHAIAGWPAWPLYAEALGGRFLYKPAELRGQARSDSGYLGDIRYDIRLGDSAHPVLDGLPPRFALTDELYRQEILGDDSVIPLLYRDTPVDADAYNSAVRAIRRVPEGEGAPWIAPPDNPLIGWAKAAGNSPLVYLQPGDSAATYADANYRTLLGNALRWVTSEPAREWARSFAAAKAEG